jgi:hydroxymethylglutaryl-CoA reductase
LTIPAWNIDQSMSPAESVADGTAPLLKFLIRALGVEAETMRIDVDARIPPAIGLGSSAALAVALIRAISKSFAIELSDADINKLAFDCEKLAHGTPSGIDNTLAVYGRPIVFQSAGAKSIRELALRENPPLVIASSGSRGSTREQVDGIRCRRKESQDAYERIFDEIGRVSIEGSEALVKGDFAGLGALMNINQGLLNALGVSTPLLEVQVWEEKILPANGVYATVASVGEQTYPAATNIGTRPTVDGHHLTVEAHLLDFAGDLYDREITLTFIGRIRDEQKFSGLEALVAQIQMDVTRTREMVANIEFVDNLRTSP